ncbi:MAG: FliM/FliN family flagellar motor switch protein [Oscillospiraceae bacterium]|nr:FliM/FliN family flagellar motor switch protein [Oscillospiraceae bacterium]
MDWIQRMNLVLDYIENNLDGEIEENRIAELSANPKGMFQRIFSVLTDMSLSEYIRKRRLTQAAYDIQNTDEKIIDIAVKYGYNSADAFSFAFKNFHGVTPSDAKKSDVEFQSFYPLVFEFKLSVKGGNGMQSRIIENVDVKVEVGKANISDKEIVVELGRSKLPEELNDIVVGNIIALDKKAIGEDAEPLDVLVNGQIAAKGSIGINNGISCVKITEVIDKKNNIANLETGNVIELDKNVENDLLGVFANGKLIAKGTAVVIEKNFGVRIVETIKTD